MSNTRNAILRMAVWDVHATILPPSPCFPLFFFFFFFAATRAGGGKEGRVVNVDCEMGRGMTEGAFVEMWGLLAVGFCRANV